MDPALKALWEPRSIALLGASRSPGKIGHIVFRHLKEGKARLYPVNPRASEIEGVPCYPDVAALPERVDLAVLAVPAAATPSLLEQCARAGIPAAVVLASGFGETGPEGKHLEDQLREIVRRSSIRVLGPNTLGVMMPHAGLDTTFVPRARSARPAPGGVGLISQSGATAISLMDAAAYQGVGFSGFVGIGNRVDIDENELIEAFASDGRTRALGLYLESFADGPAFLAALRRVFEKLPVVVLKSGRSGTGSRAASLHTGSLAGEDRVVNGVLRQVGAIRVYDDEEMLDAARALALAPPMRGRRVAIITPAGGHGVMLTDYVEATDRGAGLDMAPLEPETKDVLRKMVPDFASVRNPIDLTAEATPEMYGAALELLERDATVDGILCSIQFQPPYLDEELTRVVAERARAGRKPVVVVTVGGPLSLAALRQLEEAGVPGYPGLWRGVRALAVLEQRGRFLAREGGENLAGAVAAQPEV